MPVIWYLRVEYLQCLVIWGQIKAAFNSFLCYSLHYYIDTVCYVWVPPTQPEISLYTKHRSIAQGGKDENRRRWIVCETCSNSNFPWVHWEFCLPWATIPPKASYGRPQEGLFLSFSHSVRCCCHWWEGKVEGARYIHQLDEGSECSVQLCLTPWLLPCQQSVLCVCHSGLWLPTYSWYEVVSQLPMSIGMGSAGWQARLNQDPHLFPLCWEKEALCWCSGS